MARTIMFPRDGVNIVANIIRTLLEPSDTGRRVVFFCQDKDGRRYRVPRGEVTLMGSTEKIKETKVKSHG